MIFRLIVMSLILCISTSKVTAQIQNQGLTIHSTTINQKQFMKDWGLDDAEYRRYQKYMSTTGQFFYSHLDPLMVLGMIESNEDTRKHFAERYWMKAQKRVEQELIFTEEIGNAQRRLFGTQKLFDFSRLPGYQTHTSHQSSLKQFVATPQIESTKISQTTLNRYQWQDDKKIISIDYLVKKGCENCVDELKNILKKTPETVILNLYAKDLNYLEKVIFRIKKLIHTSRVVSPKRYDPILWNNGNSRPVIRRNGIIDATL